MDKKKIIELLKKCLIVIVCGGLGFGVSVVIKKGTEKEIVLDVSASIELSEKQIPASIETADGEIEIVEIPTVEAVDSGNITKLIECDNGEEECGLGRFIYAPIDSPQIFKDYVYGKCWDTDQSFNEQCWDLGDLYWQNYVGRRLSTCGTGAAKGTWEGDCKFENSKDDFELIYDPNQIQPGDWVVFNNGEWGHIGMALGGNNNGYVALLGQNQGGALCEGSVMGGSANIINISLKNFAGAFRPKIYIHEEEEVEVEIEEEKEEVVPISGCLEWGVQKGDTMSGIMLSCEGIVVYGEAMDNYARSWKSRIYKPGQTVYDGWHSESGVGLYYGDVIDHDI